MCAPNYKTLWNKLYVHDDTQESHTLILQTAQSHKGTSLYKKVLSRFEQGLLGYSLAETFFIPFQNSHSRMKMFMYL
jgi:hypothetical protein